MICGTNHSTRHGRFKPPSFEGLWDSSVFSYTVAEGDADTDGIAIAANKLALNGGAIRAGPVDATLTHAALAAQSGHKVDGVKPTLVSAETSTDGWRIFVTFNETIGSADSQEFAVNFLALGSGSVTAANVSGKTVELTVLSALTPAQKTLTVFIDESAVKDAAGNGNVKYNHYPVTNNVGTNNSRATSLTASFSSVPPEHDGSTVFRLSLAFSEEPHGLSYRTVRDVLFEVTGGTVTGARRLAPPSNLRYELTVAPSSDEPVTLSLAALPVCGAPGSVCTADGRALSGPLSKTVPGPAALAVADATVREGPGAVLAFTVTLSRAASSTVTVDYATVDGTATAGADYRATSGTLTFTAGDTSKTINVAVLDDSHDEARETLAVTLSNAAGARIADGNATGTIENWDPLPGAFMARSGRTMAVQVVEHVEERIQAQRQTGFQGRFAGWDLKRGLARELAVGFLERLGHPAGANRYGSPASGAASFGMAEFAAGDGRRVGAAGSMYVPRGGGVGAFQTPGLAGGRRWRRTRWAPQPLPRAGWTAADTAGWTSSGQAIC